MRIPSGDLAPVRKRRRGYPGYGRRRQHAWVAPVAAAAAVVLVAGGVYAVQRGQDRPAAAQPAAHCPQPTIAPPSAPLAPVTRPLALPRPGQVRLRLLNGTARAGLARTVGNALARRGFLVAGMGNAPQPLAGASRVAFGPGARPAATLVAAHLIGAELVPAPRAPRGSVDVILGSSFVRLRTGPEVSAHVRAPARPAQQQPTAGPCP